MNIKDLEEAVDKVIAVDANDEGAVDAVIKELEPISRWCKEYLIAEEEMFALEIEMFVDLIRKAVKKEG